MEYQQKKLGGWVEVCSLSAVEVGNEFPDVGRPEVLDDHPVLLRLHNVLA